MLLIAATGIWTGVAGGLTAPALDFLPTWLVRAASRPDESFGLSAAQLALGVGIYAWVAYYLCFFLPYRVLYDEYQSYDRRTAQIVKDMGNGQEYNVVLSTKLGPGFPKQLVRRMARMPPGDDRDTLGLAGIVRQRAGSHTVAKAAQNVKNKEGKWGVKMMPVKFGDMRFWGSSLFDRLDKQERRDEQTGWKKPDAPGSGDYRDNRLSYAKNMREIKVELGKTDAEMQNDPELAMLNLRDFDPNAEGGEFDLVLQDELANQGGIDPAGKNVRKNNPHEMVVTTDKTSADRERDAGVLPDGDLPAPVVSDSGVDASEQQTVRSTDDVSYNSGDTAGKALEDSIRSRSAPSKEEKIADKMTPATATRDSQDEELKRQKEKKDETGQESVAAAVGQAPRMKSSREAAATTDEPPVVPKPGSDSKKDSDSKGDPVVDKEPKAGTNDEKSIRSSGVGEEKAPQNSTGFPWDALADSIRSVTRDIEKEERKEESKREKAVDLSDRASPKVVSKPGSASDEKEGSSVDESQGKSGRSDKETSPSSGDSSEEKATPSKASSENDTDVVTPETTSEKPIDASPPKVSKPGSASGSEEGSSVDRPDPKTRESTEKASPSSPESDDAAGVSVGTSGESSASSKEQAAEEANSATATTDARIEDQEQQQEAVSKTAVDVVTNDSRSKVPVVSKPGSGSGWKEDTDVEDNQEKDVGSTDKSGSGSDVEGKSPKESTESSESFKVDLAEATPATGTPDTGDKEAKKKKSSAEEKAIDSDADDTSRKTPAVSKPGSGSGWENDSSVDSVEQKDTSTGEEARSENGETSGKAPASSGLSSSSAEESSGDEAGQELKSATDKPVDVANGDPSPEAPEVSKPSSSSGREKDGGVSSSEKKDAASTDATGSESNDTAETSVGDSGKAIASSEENAAGTVTPVTAAPAVNDEDEDRPQISTGEKPVEIVADESLPKAPVVSKPVVSKPVVSEPVVSKPVVSEPVVSKPVVSEPVVSKPVVSEPVVSKPVVSEPVVSKPVVSEPVVSKPVVSKPVVSKPVISKPVVSEPVISKPVVSKPSSGSGWEKSPVEDSGEEKDARGTDSESDGPQKSAEDPVESSASQKETVADEGVSASAAHGAKEEGEEEQQQPSVGKKAIHTNADVSLPKMPAVSKPGSGSGWEKVPDEGSREAKSVESTDDPGSDSEDSTMKNQEDSARSSSSTPTDVAEPVPPAPATHDAQDDDEEQLKDEPRREDPSDDRKEEAPSAGAGSDGGSKADLGARESDGMASNRETAEDVKFPWNALADSIRSKPSLEGDADDTAVSETISVDGKGDADAVTDSPPVGSDAGSGSDPASTEDFSIAEDLGLEDEGDDWLLVLSPNGAGVLLEEDFEEEEDELEVVRNTDEISPTSDASSGTPMEDLIRSRASLRGLPGTMQSAIPLLDGSILSHMQSFSLAHMLFQEWLLPIQGVTEDEESS
ncbi:unnamed protein product [Scytosiphon promiscuus]